MQYKDKIDPELKRIARNIPYNRCIIKCANLFQVISCHCTLIPREIAYRSIEIKGYKGLTYKVGIFEPLRESGKLPCLIYAHGGAFSYKASAYHKKLAYMYAAGASCKVFFPDYHLTPKYPYPAAYEDVLALYKHLMEHAEEFGINAEKIGAAGDSAGASIAALICNRYEREGLKRPYLQMLVYPLTDITMQTESMKRYTDTPLWNSRNNKRMWAYYCRGLETEASYAASPMHSDLPQIIPDTYIETAEYDCLHDEGIQYGEKLQEAGARVEINETRGTIHGYDSAIETKIAVSNIEKRVLFLKDRFCSGSSIQKGLR